LNQRMELFPKSRSLPYFSTETANTEVVAALANLMGERWLVEEWILLKGWESIDSAAVLKMVRLAMVTA